VDMGLTDNVARDISWYYLHDRYSKHEFYD
jgi:hypothetical protein